MIYDEFQRHLGKAGLSIRQFAELVKMHPNSITNCRKSGEVPSHVAVIAALMGEMAEKKIDFIMTLSAIEITPKKARGNPSQFAAESRSKRGNINAPSNTVQTASHGEQDVKSAE